MEQHRNFRLLPSAAPKRLRVAPRGIIARGTITAGDVARKPSGILP